MPEWESAEVDLPGRMWSTAVEHLTTAELATRTGWTSPQIARLLRGALRTVTSKATLPA